MIYQKFRFLSGRFHGTPWGHHVNEGVVEWPPSPWRIMRGMLATGFSKSGWKEDRLPPELSSLMEKLASAPPSYCLPPARTAHTRHYMPTMDKTKKVLDAFAIVGSEPLWVAWPCELNPEEEALFDALTSSMGYLGRAESWVEGSAHNEAPTELAFSTTPLEGAMPPNTEEVMVLAPLPAKDCQTQLETARGAIRQSLEQRLAAKGKKPSKAAYRKAEGKLPDTLLACLLTPTATLQGNGIGGVPGAAPVRYGRPNDALFSPMRPRKPPPPARKPIEMALVALSSDTVAGKLLPRKQHCVAVGEAIHRRLARLLDKQPPSEGVAQLVGKTPQGEVVRGHTHAHYLPLSLGRAASGRMDHVLLWAPGGLGDAAQEAIEALGAIFDRDHDVRVFTRLAMQGSRQLFLSELGELPLLGKARVWESTTPFIPPRYLKRSGKNRLRGQLQAELACRGLPEVAAIDILDQAEVKQRGFYAFRRYRQHRSRRPPNTRPYALRIHFRETVTGPLALGYGSHFGLGIFTPSAEPAP